MSEDLEKLILTLPPDLQQTLRDLQKEYFADCPPEEMIRTLLVAGVLAAKIEKQKARKKQENREER